MIVHLFCIIFFELSNLLNYKFYLFLSDFIIIGDFKMANIIKL